MSDIVTLPKDMAVRIVEFMNAAAGEGMYFELIPGDLYRHDPADILFDLVYGYKECLQWFPEDVAEAWGDLA